ncbi:30S ribosomal protein S3 [Haploplasma modicum]|jgi:small subunit ribosomal protein S3|uniref:30S ribosomal protein S3 n=1 Tax=Haploplasma modicum TaxID=2150 RepID=UPI0027D46367|nr:30S ribosomal protein S3 [Haploplasma modicum]
MGQKVNPIGLRVGVIRDWDSKWYADSKQVPALIKEDANIRTFLNKKHKEAAVSHVEIERLKGAKGKDRVKITLHTAKPGLVIGRDAVTLKETIQQLEKLTKKEIVLNVVEVRKPEIVATLVAQSMADQLEKRASFRRVQKIAIQRALKAGAKGIKTSISGRLGGAEMARAEGYSEGQVPLHTLRADVEYATAEAYTTYGILGVKVWIYHGEILPGQNHEEIRKERQSAPAERSRRPQQRRAPRQNDKKGGN